jgi:hypothetical protein
MSGIFSRIARLFSPKIVETESMPPAERSFGPIDSNASTAAWFDGKQLARRDSIDSNPDTARWYRKPRFVNQPLASHRTSLVGGGS